jgi:hypothetical protein
MSPERKLEAYLVKRCNTLSLMTRKVQWIGHNGAPDRVIFAANGHMYWVELKSLQGKPSMIQEQEIGRMTARGQYVKIARTKEDVDEIIARLLLKVKLDNGIFSPPRLPDPDNSSDP